MSEKRLKSEHGVVCRLPGEKLGYFGWPTVAKLDNGTLVVSSSGLRSGHVCPWGKTVLNFSTDEGRTWSPPRVINNSPLDDRDSGIVDLGGGHLLVSWFTADNRNNLKEEWLRKWLGNEEVNSWEDTLNAITDDIASKYLGSWIMLSDDYGKTWGKPIRVPVSTPHGPIRLRNTDLLYLGKPFETWKDMVNAAITATRSTDGGHTWQVLGQVPVYPGTDPTNYHEAHVVELASGRLLGIIRIEDADDKNKILPKLESVGIINFSMMQTESDDGGKTWATPRPLGYHGSPPHLLHHSSGVMVLTYGYRLAPFGQRASLSHDEGKTWESDWIIRDDGPDWDLGYPSTVELNDGSLFTVCYQKVSGNEKTSLLWSRWHLP
jgi:sialidase-1